MEVVWPPYPTNYLPGLLKRMMADCILGLFSFTKNVIELLFVMFADSKELVPFDVVFLMRLRYISQNTRIAEIIKSQHKLLNPSF